MGQTKPWSEDRVFQTTYFCNVHREDDRVTKFIRGMYNPYVDDRMFVYNIVLARFINWPDTLSFLKYQHTYDPEYLKNELYGSMRKGYKTWGGAYVITTHGQKMSKVDYLVDQVLKDVYARGSDLEMAVRRSCATTSATLQGINGIGSFLAAQIVADLKNTPGHPLYLAEDKYTFVEPGPGSIRGANWFFQGNNALGGWEWKFAEIRKYVDNHWPLLEVEEVDNQDLQNCLCEYDKYCRVASGTGRSKRSYPGIS